MKLRHLIRTMILAGGLPLQRTALCFNSSGAAGGVDLSASDLTGTNAAHGTDPDHNGLPNAVEYILGGNPTVSAQSGIPTATSSGGNLLFTFSRDDESETPDVTLTVESGADLMHWPTVFTIGPDTESSSTGVSITENGDAPDTITVTMPRGTSTRLFARLKVTVTQSAP